MAAAGGVGALEQPAGALLSWVASLTLLLDQHRVSVCAMPASQGFFPQELTVQHIQRAELHVMAP